jgi:hypothetical protein
MTGSIEEALGPILEIVRHADTAFRDELIEIVEPIMRRKAKKEEPPVKSLAKIGMAALANFTRDEEIRSIFGDTLAQTRNTESLEQNQSLKSLREITTRMTGKELYDFVARLRRSRVETIQKQLLDRRRAFRDLSRSSRVIPPTYLADKEKTKAIVPTNILVSTRYVLQEPKKKKRGNKVDQS